MFYVLFKNRLKWDKMKLYQIEGKEQGNTKGQKRKNKLNRWHRHSHGKRLKVQASGQREGVFE